MTRKGQLVEKLLVGGNHIWLPDITRKELVPLPVLLFRPTHPASSVIFSLTRELPQGEWGLRKAGVSPEQWEPTGRLSCPRNRLL